MTKNIRKISADGISVWWTKNLFSVVKLSELCLYKSKPIGTKYFDLHLCYLEFAQPGAHLTPFFPFRQRSICPLGRKSGNYGYIGKMQPILRSQSHLHLKLRYIYGVFILIFEKQYTKVRKRSRPSSKNYHPSNFLRCFSLKIIKKLSPVVKNTKKYWPS